MKFWPIILSKKTIIKLAEKTNLIATVNPSHRVNIEGSRDLACLEQAINKLADRYEKLSKIIQQKLQLASAKTEDERNILADSISELSEGVLVCNAEGKILFLNRRARQHLAINNNNKFNAGDESNRFFELGHSISNVIDKNLVEHALDEINERLKRKVLNAVSSFLIEGKGNHVLRAQVTPILNRLGQFTGFTLILKDITEQRKADNRVDSLLQSITKSARSPLASIRASIEAMLEYPDMDSMRLQQFKEIIYKESISLSNILNQIASDYSSLVKSQQSLVPIFGADLIETIRRRAKDRLGILVNVSKPIEKIRLRVDSYSIIIAILYVLNQLKNELGNWEFSCQLEKDKKFVNLDLIWHGNPVRAETLRKWEEQFLVIQEEKSPLTLNEVLGHHEAAILSYACTSFQNQSCVRFILPAEDKLSPDITTPITIMPESRAELSNLERFNQPGQNPELDNRLLTELTYNVLIREISEATSIEEIIDKHSQLPRLLHSMITSGATIRNVTWLITTFSDAILKKMIEFAIKEFGPPPVRFAFIILGSEGRKEQTLKTDQDNAIIFEDVGEISVKSKEDVKSYFIKLGEKVCTWLDQAGYNFCTGGVMAKNPKWCQPLSNWKIYFSTWIHAAEPEDLLHSTIFFDFRLAYGDPDLVDDLSNHLFASLVGWTGFFRHMTENAVYFKPPIGFFGNFLVKSEGKYRYCLNIKNAMTPIVDFARIYALKNNIKETNTQERLYQLYLKKILSRDEYNEIEQAYSFIMQIRFMQQIYSIIDEGIKPVNYINPKKLSTIEQKMLKEVFKRIERIQTKLSFEFTGESDSHKR